MIFHNFKLIFIHVERTGGVALRNLLLRYEDKFERLVNTKHLMARKVKELIDKNIWDSYFKFGFVRNPFDRLVSWYYACNQTPKWDSCIANYMQNSNSFEEIIKKPHPQLLVTQLEKLKGVDKIYRFEDYIDEVKSLCNKLEISCKIEKENESKHKYYRNYYTEDLRNIVKERYKEDLEKFNYQF